MTFNSHENAPRPGFIASAPITVPAAPEPQGPSTWIPRAVATVKRRWVAFVSAAVTLIVLGGIGFVVLTVMNIRPSTDPAPVAVGVTVDPAVAAAQAVAVFTGAATKDGLAVADGEGKFAGFVVAFRDVNANGKMDGDEVPVRGSAGQLPTSTK